MSIIAVLLAVGGCSTDGGDNSAPDANPVFATDAGAPGAFMSECQDNVDCESSLCFQFNAKGPHCTHECTVAEDCEDPSPGCNNKGVCKAP